MKQHEKIQNLKFPLRSEASKIQILLNRLNFLLAILLIVFLSLNILGSQFISPIYSQFSSNDKKATVVFLQKIKEIPEYQKILDMNNNIFGNTVKDEIFTADNKKNAMINILEQQLAYTPKSRDILYGLYQLYLANGDLNRADQYFKQAKEIDPGIK